MTPCSFAYLLTICINNINLIAAHPFAVLLRDHIKHLVDSKVWKTISFNDFTSGTFSNLIVTLRSVSPFSLEKVHW